MPDLGTYAVPVLSAYGATGVIIALLIWASWRRGRKVRQELHALEGRRKDA
ncbi:MAG: heme exporter protein CcmD [Pseudomonadota bacterium]